MRTLGAKIIINVIIVFSFCFNIILTNRVKLFVKYKSQHTQKTLDVFVSVSSRGLVRDCERPGDPSGVRGSEPDPPGDQTAAPAACHDPGRAASIRFCHH